MKKGLFLFLSLFFLQEAMALKSGEGAPDFSLVSSTGKTVKLSDYKGKVVVLEWLNHGCPFVRKHYDSNNMQKLQEEASKQGAVWLSIISSAPGKQGHSDPAQAEADKKKYNSKASAILLDEKGVVGKMYGAQTTPHMYVINKEGTLVYQGAIDNKPSADQDDIAGAENYVRNALSAVAKGQPVANAQTKAYGCSVKY